MTDRIITVAIQTVDRCNRTRTFKTAKGALAFIDKWVGNPASAECNTVVSFDGIAVARCSEDILGLVAEVGGGNTFPSPDYGCPDCGSTREHTHPGL